MALSSSLVWEVRSSTGNDLNGGAFRTGATGTDYSQQDGPQVFFTDLAITATATQVTSSASPFTAAHVGNVLNVAAGAAGFTAGRYEILAVASGVATLDRAAGTANSAGGTARLGGALQTLGGASGSAVTGNILYATGAFAPSGGSAALSGVALIGYGAARGDGLRCSVSGASQNAATDTISLNGGAIALNVAVTGSKQTAFSSSGAGYCGNCTASGGTHGFFAVSLAYSCSASGCSTYGFFNTTCYACHATACGSNGFISSNGGQSWVACVSRLNSGAGYGTLGVTIPLVDRCVAYGNTSHGFSLAPGGATFNCVAFANGGFGFNLSASLSGHVGLRACYAGANTSGNVSGAFAAIDVGAVASITAQPFADPTGVVAVSFLPNNVAGGGAVLRGGGWSLSIPGISGSSAQDAGAYQHPDAGIINVSFLEG